MKGGGVFLMNGWTDICDCIVAFATENEVLTQSMTTILLMSKNQRVVDSMQTYTSNISLMKMLMCNLEQLMK